jgi:hypothetical protein
MRGAMRLRAGFIHKIAILENKLESPARDASSKISAMHRHNAVPMSFQLTSGSGRYFSIGESLTSRAICGMAFALAAESSHTWAPERSVTRSSSNTAGLPSTVKESTRSRFVPAGSPSGLPLTAPTSNCASRSRICCNCRASSVPSYSRRLAGNFRRSRYRQAR